MKRTKENYPFFNLFSIVGTWESINLNPTVIIYRNDRDYLFSIIYVSYIVFKVTKLCILFQSKSMQKTMNQRERCEFVGLF